MRSSLFLAASLASIAAANPSPGIADARGLVHDALWGSMASISSQPQTLGWPFNNIVSFADGTVWEAPLHLGGSLGVEHYPGKLPQLLTAQGLCLDLGSRLGKPV